MYQSIAMSDHGVVMDGMHHQLTHNLHSIFIKDHVLYGINWPSAYEHPLFFVGLYAAIGGINVLINVSSVVAQYTAALRASRILFK